MAKKTIEIRVPEAPSGPHSFLTAEVIQEAFGLSAADVHNSRLGDFAELTKQANTQGETEIGARIVQALELYESLAPADGAEGMLAQQMVATHFAALECLRRAALPNQSFEGRDQTLKHAYKLMNLYTQQLSALNKYRGKGQQKVTVEHVHVAPGGQAIVGHVETGRPGQPAAAAPAQIEGREEIPLAAITSRSRARRGPASEG